MTRQREPVRELIECRDCGEEFDLASQHYYDNQCPACKSEDNPEHTWPGCAVCSERVPPDERATKKFPPTGPGQTTEFLTVHEDCK